MVDENKEAVVDQEEAEEERDDDSLGTSEAKAAILKERAETHLEEQDRRIELLMKQVSRLETIKYGVLTLVLIAGFYSGPEITNPPTFEIVTSLVWFLIVGFSITFSTVFSKYLGRLSSPIPFVSDQDSADKDIVDELVETPSDLSDEETDELIEKAKEITAKNGHIKELEHELRFSHLILAIILISVLVFGLPSFTLFNLFGPMIII